MFEVQYIDEEFKAGWYIVEKGIWIVAGPFLSEELAYNVLQEKEAELEIF
jgi:hypothetical protein